MSLSLGLLLLWACLWPLGARAQPARLARDFPPGGLTRYHVHLTLRSGLAGEEAIPRGQAAYVHPFERWASSELAWVSTEHVLALSSDGTAQIEETLDDFTLLASQEPADPEARKLVQAIRDSLQRWSRPATIILRYRVTRRGHALGLDLAGVPALSEAAPPLLTLWLLHALRPEEPLPDRPLRLGSRWSERQPLRLADWSEVRAWELGQWLGPVDLSEPAVRLLVSQQITAAIAAGPEKPPEGSAAARFSSEALATLSLSDGSLLAATRTAMREISWTLRPVTGLAEPPQFRLRLAAEVRIERCNGACR